jgi:hydroxymethylbilane synthase
MTNQNSNQNSKRQSSENSQRDKLIIGARGSLLSITQSTITKTELEENSNTDFDIKKILTQGDQIQDKPLWQLEGKDFFTKELDAALLRDEVDLVIHSYKDLGSERPDGIKLGAITQRKFANDILLIKKESVEMFLAQGKIDKMIVGTSSPRRIVNTESHLNKFLPFLGTNSEVKCEMLRGNVNTRIQKLKDGKYDAIILALAGIDRLAGLENSKKELEILLDGLTFCILPQSLFTSATSQGALAIEYHENSPKAAQIQKILDTVHCEKTESEMKIERATFQTYGGGCHLAVGIYTKRFKNYYLQYERGQVDEVNVVKKSFTKIDSNEAPEKYDHVFLGFPVATKWNQERIVNDELIKKEATQIDLPENGNLYISSRYSVEKLDSNKNHSLWSAGIKTHIELTKKGYWVCGSADSFGHDEIINIQTSNALKLMLPSNDWYILSHKDSVSDIGKTIESYQRIMTSPNDDFEERLKNVEACYWTSIFQYETYMNKYSFLKDKPHYCGLGKTWQEFQKKNIKVTPLLDTNGILN